MLIDSLYFPSPLDGWEAEIAGRDRGPWPTPTCLLVRFVVLPVSWQRGIALHAKQAPPLPLHVLHAAEQLVVGVLCVTGGDAVS